MIINEKLGTSNKAVIADGLYRFRITAYKKTISNRGEPLLEVNTILDIGEKYDLSFVLTRENSGRLCDFFVSVGLKTRGVPINVDNVIENLVNTQGYVMIVDGFPTKFLNFRDMEELYDRLL